MNRKVKKNTYLNNIVTIAMCTAFIVVSSWLSIPFSVNFTLQLLAIFIISDVFDLRISISSVALYIAIGLCGLPVFSGFGAGFSCLLGPSGGYIVGFLLVPIIIHLIRIIFNHTFISLLVSNFLALIACYALGTLWYAFFYVNNASTSLIAILSVCVFPFIAVDFIKIIIASIISLRLKKYF